MSQFNTISSDRLGPFDPNHHFNIQHRIDIGEAGLTDGELKAAYMFYQLHCFAAYVQTKVVVSTPGCHRSFQASDLLQCHFNFFGPAFKLIHGGVYDERLHFLDLLLPSAFPDVWRAVFDRPGVHTESIIADFVNNAAEAFQQAFPSMEGFYASQDLRPSPGNAPGVGTQQVVVGGFFVMTLKKGLRADEYPTNLRTDAEVFKNTLMAYDSSITERFKLKKNAEKFESGLAVVKVRDDVAWSQYEESRKHGQDKYAKIEAWLDAQSPQHYEDMRDLDALMEKLALTNPGLAVNPTTSAAAAAIQSATQLDWIRVSWDAANTVNITTINYANVTEAADVVSPWNGTAAWETAAWDENANVNEATGDVHSDDGNGIATADQANASEAGDGVNAWNGTAAWLHTAWIGSGEDIEATNDAHNGEGNGTITADEADANDSDADDADANNADAKQADDDEQNASEGTADDIEFADDGVHNVGGNAVAGNGVHDTNIPPPLLGWLGVHGNANNNDGNGNGNGSINITTNVNDATGAANTAINNTVTTVVVLPTVTPVTFPNGSVNPHLAAWPAAPNHMDGWLAAPSPNAGVLADAMPQSESQPESQEPEPEVEPEPEPFVEPEEELEPEPVFIVDEDEDADGAPPLVEDEDFGVVTPPFAEDVDDDAHPFIDTPPTFVFDPSYLPRTTAKDGKQQQPLRPLLPALVFSTATSIIDPETGMLVFLTASAFISHLFSALRASPGDDHHDDHLAARLPAMLRGLAAWWFVTELSEATRLNFLTLGLPGLASFARALEDRFPAVVPRSRALAWLAPSEAGSVVRATQCGGRSDVLGMRVLELAKLAVVAAGMDPDRSATWRVVAAKLDGTLARFFPDLVAGGAGASGAAGLDDDDEDVEGRGPYDFDRFWAAVEEGLGRVERGLRAVEREEEEGSGGSDWPREEEEGWEEVEGKGKGDDNDGKGFRLLPWPFLRAAVLART